MATSIQSLTFNGSLTSVSKCQLCLTPLHNYRPSIVTRFIGEPPVDSCLHLSCSLNIRT